MYISVTILDNRREINMKKINIIEKVPELENYPIYITGKEVEDSISPTFPIEVDEDSLMVIRCVTNNRNVFLIGIEGEINTTSVMDILYERLGAWSDYSMKERELFIEMLGATGYTVYSQPSLYSL